MYTCQLMPHQLSKPMSTQEQQVVWASPIRHASQSVYFMNKPNSAKSSYHKSFEVKTMTNLHYFF